MATIERTLIVFCILMKMWKYYCTGSTLAAFTILLLVRLLYGQRRTLASWLRTLPTFYHLLRQSLKQVLHVVPRFGTGLAEGKLVFISCMHWLVPNACPSSKDTTRLESRSILLPTMMQLTFWLMDMSQGGVLAHFIVPMGDVVEALSVGNVIDNGDTVGVAVVAVGDGAKSLLSGCAPLSRWMRTSNNLAFSPLTVTVLVFWVRREVRSRRRWCWATWIGTYLPECLLSYWEAKE